MYYCNYTVHPPLACRKKVVGNASSGFSPIVAVVLLKKSSLTKFIMPIVAAL